MTLVFFIVVSALLVLGAVWAIKRSSQEKLDTFTRLCRKAGQSLVLFGGLGCIVALLSFASQAPWVWLPIMAVVIGGFLWAVNPE
jgi:uncharacterized membrane protein SirB2